MLIKNFKKALYLIVFSISFSAVAGSYDDFFSALERDSSAEIGRLLRRGFDPNSRDSSGRPGLTIALQKESYAAAATLFEHPQLDVNALNMSDESALMMAALKGQESWCKRLIERGAFVNKTGWTPLHYAASGPNPAVLAVLLDKGADINAPSPNHTTPLMMAAQYGAEDSVRLLLARGADSQRKNDQGLTAVDFAQRAGREKLAEQLRSGRF